jgi:hypothetical protein
VYKVRDIQRYTSVEMEEYEIPSSQLINEKKFNKLFSEVNKFMDNNDLTMEINVIEKIFRK